MQSRGVNLHITYYIDRCVEVRPYCPINGKCSNRFILLYFRNFVVFSYRVFSVFFYLFS